MPAPIHNAIPLALALDLLLGDPPNRFHPVAWMGNWIAAWKARQQAGRPYQDLAYGAAITLSGTTLAILGGLLVTRLARRLPAPARALAEALALKLCLSLRGLDQAAAEIQAALQAGDLAEARRLLSWHLVSRDTMGLSVSQVAAAAIESVAENASDGVIAPLFYYWLGGLPLALAYRYINTCDAMLGYHDSRHEWLGKFPARLDDLTNLVPARLTAGFILLAAGLLGLDWRQAGRIYRRDAGLTTSPNAGRPMSAMAGALGVQLEKTDHYRLGAGLPLPTPPDLGRARRVLRLAALLSGAALLGARFLRPVMTKRWH